MNNDHRIDTYWIVVCGFILVLTAIFVAVYVGTTQYQDLKQQIERLEK